MALFSKLLKIHEPGNSTSKQITWNRKPWHCQSGSNWLAFGTSCRKHKSVLSSAANAIHWETCTGGATDNAWCWYSANSNRKKILSVWQGLSPKLCARWASFTSIFFLLLHLYILLSLTYIGTVVSCNFLASIPSSLHWHIHTQW